jgi:hypothetical protein
MEKFWSWYQRHFSINVTITSFLFALQLFHLYWLFTDVVLFKLTGHSYFTLQSVWGEISIFFDYTEVPALLSTTVLYLHLLRQKFTYKSLLYLLLVNSQWLHIFWITDEYVISQFITNNLVWSAWLAWLAILIDFLELPVIFDTAKQTILHWKNPEAIKVESQDDPE